MALPRTRRSAHQVSALAAIRADGLDERLIDFYAWLYDDIHRDRNARITGDIELVLGRPPRRFWSYLEHAAQVWMAPPPSGSRIR